MEYSLFFFLFFNAIMNFGKKGRASIFCRFHKLVNSLELLAAE